MFVLPSTWDEARLLLNAILMFYDRAPLVFVHGVQESIDFEALCRQMPGALETFLRTGLSSAWPVPIEIHGTHADWIILPCGVLANRPKDFVLRWNARAIRQPPQWALNHPGIAAFFPHLSMVKQNCGHLDFYIWQQIWQQVCIHFFRGNAWQQLVELKSFCDQDMANTTWSFKEAHLIALLSPEQQQQWTKLPSEEMQISEPAVVSAERLVEGFLELPVMACCKGHGIQASYFCTVCTQLYCNDCSLLPEHVGHVFKFLK